MRVSSASTRAPYSLFNACSSARSAPTSSAAAAIAGDVASANAATNLILHMESLLPEPANKNGVNTPSRYQQKEKGGARERNAEKARGGTETTAMRSTTRSCDTWTVS